MTIFRSREGKKGSKDGDGSKRKRVKNSAATKSAMQSVMQKQDELPSRESICIPHQKVTTGYNSAKWTQIRPFVTHMLQIGVSGLSTEFHSKKRKINSIEDQDKMKDFYRENQNNTGRNRYKDVGCLDATRVKLKGVTGNDVYIHANYVATPKHKKRFICTQAPTDKTICEFWHMIVQDKCEYILMLCEIMEKGLNKCAVYWPAQNCTTQFGDVKVYCAAASWRRMDGKANIIVKNELHVTVKGRPTHVCTQYRWKDWPDRGVPEIDGTPCVVLKEMETSLYPIVIHCSAGVGRTGAIVLIQHIIEMVESGAVINECASLLEQLRKQRHNSVQTEHQYLFVHAVLLNYFIKSGFMDQSVLNDVAAFQQEYEKAIAAFK